MTPPTPPSRLRRLARFVERSLAFTGVFFLVYHAAFDVSEVVSDSMAPTLASQGGPGSGQNDWILTEQISTRFGPPPRQKLIAFVMKDGTKVAKRVVGYGGEALRIVDGCVEVDGVTHAPAEPSVRYIRAGRLRPRRDPSDTFQVPEGEVFVLGDHSRDSWDSRFFGGLPEQRWRGRVVAVVWPPSRWRWLW